jgi:hypothetical protein
MPKYFMTWEVDPTRVPIDLKERGGLWGGMVEIVKQEIKDGITTDWGCFVGESKGYSVGEQSEIDLAKTLQQFYPFVTFEVHQVMTIDEMAEVIQSMTE